jgi:hypothetical protein
LETLATGQIATWCESGVPHKRGSQITRPDRLSLLTRTINWR